MATILVASLCFLSLATFLLLSAEQYGRVAAMRLCNGAGTAIAQVCGGLVYPDVWVLVLTYALGNLLAASIAVPSLVQMRQQRDSSSLRTVLSEERMARFSITVGTGAVLSNLGLALPLIGVSLLFGDAAAGSFYLARRLLMVPTQLVASSVSEVGYGIASRQTAAEIYDSVQQWLKRFRAVAACVLLAGLALAPLMSHIVGAGYQAVGWIVLLLTLPAIAQMIATSFSNVLLALHLEMVRTLWSAGRVLGLLLLFWLAQKSEANLLPVLGAFSAYTVATYLFLLLITLRGIAHRKDNP